MSTHEKLYGSYTVDFLTKEVRKNEGEMKQYLIENSHAPIIEPEVFDRVQEKLAQYAANRKHNHSSSPFANRLICGDCGEFYGHKVWHNNDNTKRYDVWYCNHRYNGCEKCQTPVLKETDIKVAFVAALKMIHYKDPCFDEALWRKLVERATISREGQISFRFTDGQDICITI